MELPEDIELLIEQHNKNHEKIDQIKSYNQRRQLQATNKKIRDKLVEDLEVPRRQANKLVDSKIPPRQFRSEAK